MDAAATPRATSCGGCGVLAKTHRPGRAMEEKKGDGRKKKIGAFWSVNFIKHIKRVSSGICQRVVKLQWYVCNITCLVQTTNHKVLRLDILTCLLFASQIVNWFNLF